MERSDIKVLIHRFEKNNYYYSSLLEKLETNANLDGQSSRNDLHSFITSLTAVEDEVIEFRLKKILSEENPYLPAIEVEHVTREYKNRNFTLDEIKEEFLKQRKNLIHFLYQTPAELWGRTGVHANEGHIQFRELIRRMVDKDRKNITYLSQKISDNHN